MPTLHLRNVPESVYEGLKRRARGNGRSMNAEAVALLEEVIERDRRATNITDDLRRLSRKINPPPGAPDAVEIIREMRDAPPRGL